MLRVYFQRAAGGYRAPRGEVIQRVQVALKTAGSDPGELDGIYGNDTEVTLKDFQRKQGFQPNGKVTDETWSKLTGGRPPALRKLVAMIDTPAMARFRRRAAFLDNLTRTENTESRGEI